MKRPYITHDDLANALENTWVVLFSYAGPDFSIMLKCRVADRMYQVIANCETVVETTKSEYTALNTYNSWELARRTS